MHILPTKIQNTNRSVCLLTSYIFIYILHLKNQTNKNKQELAIYVNALGRLAAASGYRPPRIFMEKVRLLFEAKVHTIDMMSQCA